MTPEHKALVERANDTMATIKACAPNKTSQAALEALCGELIAALSTQCAQPQAGEPVDAFEYCDGCSGYECDPIKGCAYPGASAPPANPAQVTDAMVEAALAIFQQRMTNALGKEIVRSALTAAIGAGGQAVALSLAEKALAILTRWTGEAYLFSAHEISKAVGAPKKSMNKALSDLIAIGRVERVQCTNGTFYKLAALSQPHPADERVVEAMEAERREHQQCANRLLAAEARARQDYQALLDAHYHDERDLDVVIEVLANSRQAAKEVR